MSDFREHARNQLRTAAGTYIRAVPDGGGGRAVLVTALPPRSATSPERSKLQSARKSASVLGAATPFMRITDYCLIEDANIPHHQQAHITHNVVSEVLLADVIAFDIAPKSLPLQTAAVRKITLKVKANAFL